MMNKSEQLRAIGQDLEGLEFTMLQIRGTDNGYFVKGISRKPSSRIRRLLTRIKSYDVVLEHHYDPKSLEKIQARGLARRRNRQGEPDSRSVSHLLRVLGAELDLVQGSLVRLEKLGGRIVLELEKRDGTPRVDVHFFDSLSDISTWIQKRQKGEELQSQAGDTEESPLGVHFRYTAPRST